VIKGYFHPDAKVEMAISQITAIVQTILRVLPPGIIPPNTLKYDASSVPILQLGLSSQSLSERDVYDLGQNFIRTAMAAIPSSN
jgi:multidrug efflux pump subunit AcrB